MFQLPTIKISHIMCDCRAVFAVLPLLIGRRREMRTLVTANSVAQTIN